MSEPIPESVPTSVSNRSRRPLKRRALTPSSQQSAEVDALFANPDRADNVVAVGPKSRVVQAPPEIVANVQGSSAGAGSGEFHVYKASRRREYERLRAMDEDVKAEAAERDFQERKEERERKDEEKLNKNRARRQKAKDRKEKRERASPAAKAGEADNEDQSKVESRAKRKLGPAKGMSSQMGETVTKDVLLDSNSNDQAGDTGAGITIHDDD